ncbi:hypothetical protein [Lysobacter sp. CFH 32150]|uniref:hypothetical protein n=1 Tax=Lysobacter sp. CFH 32150 TaxID=2927128 RepID=UPI001FA7AD7E|nr:hypothetical protein [Lysobacter sp. CFH 32150]MCI4568475.1 hypothetical protein [Lysobacter sp. CFH 32150]
MPESSAWKFSYKRRDELDALIDKFEEELSYRLSDLQAHYSAYADTILSMTGAHDDQYVSERINTILKSRGLLSDTSANSDPAVSSERHAAPAHTDGDQGASVD